MGNTYEKIFHTGGHKNEKMLKLISNQTWKLKINTMDTILHTLGSKKIKLMT